MADQVELVFKAELVIRVPSRVEPAIRTEHLQLWGLPTVPMWKTFELPIRKLAFEQAIHIHDFIVAQLDPDRISNMTAQNSVRLEIAIVVGQRSLR